MAAARAWYDRGPLGSPWVRDLVRRYGLPVWFLANTIPALVLQATDTSLLFFDARLYLMATRTWLDGGDPWSVQLAGNYFAAPPPSLLPLVAARDAAARPRRRDHRRASSSARPS